MSSLGEAWKNSRARSRMSAQATTVAQRSPRSAAPPGITISAAATPGSDPDSGDYSLSSFSDSFSSGVSSSPSPSVIPPCTVVPPDERRRHFPMTTAATAAAPPTSSETPPPYRGESSGSPPAVVARRGEDTVSRRVGYPAPSRPIPTRAASTGGGGGRTRGRPASENMTYGRHNGERTTSLSPAGSSPLRSQSQRSSQPPQGPGPRLHFRRSASSSLASPSSSTAPAFLPADLMYVPSMSVMMEDLPPPALPVLQSSSGSEDEGFGSADEEGSFRRLQASAGSPIVPPSPRASTSGVDRGASAYDRVLKATAAAAAAAGWRRGRESNVPPPQPSAAAGSNNRYVNVKVAAPSPSTAPPPPPPPVPEPQFFKGGQQTGGSGSAAGGSGAAAGSAGGTGAGGISSAGSSSSRGRVWGQKDRGRGSAGGGGGGRPGQLQRSLSTSSRGSSVGSRYFRDPRLETTLALIRSGQSFCEERHITADFVRRANSLGQSTVPESNGGTGAQGRAQELLRHALLITDAALYMLEVEMLPRKRQPSPSASAIPSPAGSQESLSASTQRGTDHRSLNAQDGLGSNGRESVSSTVSAAGSGWGSGSGERPPRSGSSQASGGGGAVATGGVTGGDSPVIEEGARNKAKVKSIETIDRLEAPELVRVSLPFKEVTLRNGDVMAKKGCGIVLHTRVDGRTDHVWLKCRSNQDRGALVDALVRWHESNTLQLPELNVQQVPEATLVAHLSRLAERSRSGSMRLKDTDCLIS